MATRSPRLILAVAFRIADESEPGQLTGAHLVAFVKQLGVGARYLRKLAQDVARQTAAAVSRAAAELKPQLGYTDSIMAERLVQRIQSMSKGMAKRFAEDGPIDDDLADAAEHH